jgi:hypothetical protein
MANSGDLLLAQTTSLVGSFHIVVDLALRQ